jgi:hypothetical protein
LAIAFERATDLAADELARCRTGYDVSEVEPTENERLLAGHIVGRLWANDLLNTAGEEWKTVSSEKDLKP